VDLILALDAGTSGVRTVAFNDDLEVVTESSRELTQYYPSPGEVEHDAHEIVALAVATLREVAARVHAQGHRILALGITNQRETTVGFDRANGEVFSRAIVWQDRRTAAMCRALEDAGHGPSVRATTGLVLDAYFSATKMRWMLERGVAEHASAPSFATVDTWLLWSLTGGADGGVFATEASNASRTSLLDLTTRQWSPSMLELFGIERDMLAVVRPALGLFGVRARRRRPRTRPRPDNRDPR
jgi:glycerol kinase